MRDHAVKTFLARFASLIHFVLSGFDRLRFRGESTLLCNRARGGVDSYLYRGTSYYVDFPDSLSEAHSASLSRKPTNSPGSPRCSGEASQQPENRQGGNALELAKAHPGSAPAGTDRLTTAVESCLTYRPAEEPGRPSLIPSNRGVATLTITTSSTPTIGSLLCPRANLLPRSPFGLA